MNRLPMIYLAAVTVTALTGPCLTGCSDSDDAAPARLGGGGTADKGTAGGGTNNMGGTPSPPSGEAGGGDGRGPDGRPLDPEVEMELDFQRPQASERFVYAANPEGGTVAVINAMTLEIQTLETGRRPTFLRTLAGTDDAIVLNTGDDEATIIRAAGEGQSPTTRNVEVVDGANAIEVAPDGKHAVVFFDAERTSQTTGFGDLQTVSVLTFDDGEPRVAGMSVGFKPRQVAFRDDSQRAYVVTENGISILDLPEIDEQGSAIADAIAFDTGAGERSQDVSVTPNGRYAVARRPGTSNISLVDLDTSEVTTLDLGTLYEPPEMEEEEQVEDDAGVDPLDELDVSDLDVSRDGTFAVAVLRDESAVMRIPLPDGFMDTSKIETSWVDAGVVGQSVLVPSTDLALLYTTAVDNERMAIVDLSGAEPTRVVDLRKTVFGVAASDDGRTALIIHARKEGNPFESGIGFDERVDRSHGYSLLRPTTGESKLQLTDVASGPFVVVPTGDYLFMSFRADSEGVREVHRVELENFLIAPIFKLGSPPLSIGAVPSSRRVFVSQEHPDGRMTFIDWENADPNAVDTVTGFELNSRIRD